MPRSRSSAMATAVPRPVVGTWRSRVPRGRAGHAAALHFDTCYVFGGHLGENKCTDELLSYDIRTKEWFSFNPDPSGPCERDGHTACIAGDTLYVFGGEKSGSEEELLNDLYCLDLPTMTWSIVPPTDENPAPSPRRGHSAVVLGGAIYIFGGHNSHGERRNDLFRFDLITFTWSEERPATTFNQLVVRSGHSCIAVNDHELLIFGGCKEPQHNHSSDVFKYNIIRKTWTRIPTLGEPPLQCSEHSAVVIGKYMVVYGGWISEFYIPARAVHVLDLEQWTWSAVSLGKSIEPPPEVADHVAVAWKGGMYVCGGYREVEQPTESMLIYELRLEGVGGAQEPAIPARPRLQADMLRALASYKFSDIALAAADGVEIPAHRVVLASRSEYFRALFDGEMQESQQSVIHLKTFSKEVLMTVLTFMYGGVVEVPSHLQLEVMAVADMLLLEDLKLECERHLKDAVGVDNCCAFLQSADRHGASSLRAHCLSFLVQEYESVVGSAGYASMLSSSPHLALEMSQALATRLKAISGPRTSRKRRNTMQGGGDIAGAAGGAQGHFNFV